MSYTRFALGFSRHKKINALSDLAFRLWVGGMDRAREQASDGYLDDADLDLVPRCPSRGARRTALTVELVASGLWETKGDGWQIHDYLDWQDSAEQIKARQANARQRMRTVRANRIRTDDERASEVRSRSSDQISSDLRSGSPDPDPDAREAPPVDPDPPERETKCPLDLLSRSGVRSMLAELAERLPAPIAQLETEAADFLSYWTLGEGQGRTRANWPRVLRERLRKRHVAGDLGGISRAKASAEWPTDDDQRLREAIRSGQHGKGLAAKLSAGMLDAGLARRLVREREAARAESMPGMPPEGSAGRLEALAAGIGRRAP